MSSSSISPTAFRVCFFFASSFFPRRIDTAGRLIRNWQIIHCYSIKFIARRYENGSLIITSNQPFSSWDQILPDASMTMAAVDRIIVRYQEQHNKIQSVSQLVVANNCCDRCSDVAGLDQ